jgi:hypothetical protein
MKGLVSLGLCLMLSLVLIFGSVFSSASSFTLPDNAFAADMGGGDGGDGGDSKDGDSKDGDSKDGGDNNQGDGSRNSGGDNTGNKDSDKVASTAPLKTNCPKGQEYTLFSGCVVVAENPGNNKPTAPSFI